MNIKRTVVIALDEAVSIVDRLCVRVDSLLNAWAVSDVRLGLSRWSVELDRRWKTGIWLCRTCGRSTWPTDDGECWACYDQRQP